MNHIFSQTKTVYQFMGCFFHGCKSCYCDSNVDRDAIVKERKSFNQKRVATDEINQYIKDQVGHTFSKFIYKAIITCFDLRTNF